MNWPKYASKTLKFHSGKIVEINQNFSLKYLEVIFSDFLIFESKSKYYKEKIEDFRSGKITFPFELI